MAEEALRKLEDQLNCSICLDTYTSPRLLQCLHAYCQQCLEKLVLRDRQGHLTLTCPTCRQVTPVPAGGVAGLQAAFQINQFLEIVEEHKRARSHSVEASEASPSSPGDRVGEASPTVEIVFCPEHEGRERELYCETCEELICLRCVINGAEHHSHSYKEISAAFEECKAEIVSSLEPMEKRVEDIDKELEKFDRGREAITQEQIDIAAEISGALSQLREVLDRREMELFSQLNSATETKLEGLESQKSQLELTKAQLTSCLQFMREKVETGNRGELLLTRRRMAAQVSELATAMEGESLKPNIQPNIVFSASENLISECEGYGQVSTESYASGGGLQSAEVGEKSELVVCSIDKAVKCEVVSEVTGVTVKGSVESGGRNQYNISYQPTIKGRHQLSIQVDNQHIKGSPFSVVASLPVEKLGTPILTINELVGPEGVAINKKGEVVVADWKEHCVSVFSISGKKLRSFGSYGCAQGQFQYPCAVAVDGDGNLLVADSGNHRIQKFSSDGDFLAAVGTEGCWPLQFDRPVGVAYNKLNRKVYVTDKANHQIQILNSDLSHYSTFGRRGSEEGQFNYPMHVACDANGNIYIADRGNHRIQVFTAEGEYLRMFGGRRGVSSAGNSSSSSIAGNASPNCAVAMATSSPGPSAVSGSPGTGSPSSVAIVSGGEKGRSEGLDSPFGVTVDAEGLVYVSEWGIHRVSVFTAGGQFVTSFGKWGRVLSWREYMSTFGRGQEPCGELKEPCGLAVDSTGILYVCDYGNKCVHLF